MYFATMQVYKGEEAKKYQTSSATLKVKLTEMLFSKTYLVKPPQIIQPVALLMFRVEAIPMCF
jgi:hypothetical protein